MSLIISFLNINTNNGQWYYDLFYFLAITFSGISFMLDGKLKGYSMRAWMLIFSSGIIFLIIGTKLFTYTPNNWLDFFITGKLPFTSQKTILGGIIGAIIGVGVAKRTMKFNYPVLDSFAVSFPLAMGIQRIGCFIVGCCFGTPTNLPWAINYSSNSQAFFCHSERGLLDSFSHTSLSVHPNQLYQSLFCFIIAWIIWKRRNSFKRSGNLFLSSIVLYLIARFFLEFSRDAASNGISGQTWLTIKYIQWGLLIAVLFLSLFIYYREKGVVIDKLTNSKPINSIGYLIMLWVLVLFAANWFTKTEFLFIELIFIPTSLLQLKHLHTSIHKYSMLKLATLYSLLLIVLFNGTMAAQKLYKEMTKDEDSKGAFNEIIVGYGYANYSHHHKVPYDDGCGGFRPTDPLQTHISKAIALGFTHVETIGMNRKFALIGDVSLINVTEEKSKNNFSKSIYNVGVHSKYDSKWVGGGIGLLVGNTINEENVTETDYFGIPNKRIYYTTSDDVKDYLVVAASFRVLRIDQFFLEFNYNQQSPYQIAHRRARGLQFLLGTGFGLKDGTSFQAGYDINGGICAAGKIYIKDYFGIKASTYTGIFAQNPVQMFQVSASLRIFSKRTFQNKTLE